MIQMNQVCLQLSDLRSECELYRGGFLFIQKLLFLLFNGFLDSLTKASRERVFLECAWLPGWTDAEE